MGWWWWWEKKRKRRKGHWPCVSGRSASLLSMSSWHCPWQSECAAGVGGCYCRFDARVCRSLPAALAALTWRAKMVARCEIWGGEEMLCECQKCLPGLESMQRCALASFPTPHHRHPLDAGGAINQARGIQRQRLRRRANACVHAWY